MESSDLSLRVREVMGKHIFIVLEGVELEVYAFLIRAPTRSPNKAFSLQVAFICSGASYAQYEAVPACVYELCVGECLCLCVHMCVSMYVFACVNVCVCVCVCVQ